MEEDEWPETACLGEKIFQRPILIIEASKSSGHFPKSPFEIKFIQLLINPRVPVYQPSQWCYGVCRRAIINDPETGLCPRIKSHCYLISNVQILADSSSFLFYMSGDR